MRTEADQYLEAHELGRELSADGSDENIARAKTFLSNLSDWPAIQEIISSLLDLRGTDEMVSFCLAWAEANPSYKAAALTTMLRQAPNESVLEAARQFIDENKKLWIRDDKIELNIGQLLESYLEGSDDDLCADLAKGWIAAQPEHISTPSIVNLLVERGLDADSIGIARNWLFAHKSNRSAGVVLGSLIRKGQSDLVDRAKAFLSNAKSNDDERWWILNQFSILAVLEALLEKPLNPDEWKWILDWFEANMHRDALSMTVDFLVENIGKEVPEANVLALRMLETNQAEESGTLIATLLEACPNAQTIQMAKDYLSRNPSEDYLIYVMCALLKSSRNRDDIQFAKDWLVKNQTSPDAPNVIRELAGPDTIDDEIMSCGKAWLKANPNHIQVSSVLSALTKSRHDAELVKQAKQFLDQKADYDTFVWVIRGLLKGSPDVDSIQRAKDWLSTNKHFSIGSKQNSLSNEGLVISALLDANPDSFVTGRASKWLELDPEDDRVKARIVQKLERLRRQ